VRKSLRTFRSTSPLIYSEKNMKEFLSLERVFSWLSLLLIIVFVHVIYSAQIRPQAEALINASKSIESSDKNLPVPRSFVIIVKDFEQEACFILMLWATAIISYKGFALIRQRVQLAQHIIPIKDGIKILPQDTYRYSRKIQNLTSTQRQFLLPRALETGLHRFGTTRRIQDVSTAISEVCETEFERLDSELSTIRYIVWAIPSIGFIGTVRGISQALGEAYRALEGDISGVTSNLGIAFNSTFVALLISLFVMFLMHQLQREQEKFVLDAQKYCNTKLIPHLANYDDHT
jgi:biopolymer transport protein ExbB/TolQ